MQGLFLDSFELPREAACNPQSAYRALGDAAAYYLDALDLAVTEGTLPRRIALNTRVRGTGPGVALGEVIEQLLKLSTAWQCPFEGSNNVAGAELPAAAVLKEERDDGFLLLKFRPGTLDLPLHVHDDSERFIYVIGGRGFFHVSELPMEAADDSSLRHVPARDRDVIMFRRGTAHTFSTAEHELHLLSYHRPFIPIVSPNQYRTAIPPRCPREFLAAARGRVSFDAGWNSLTNHPVRLPV